MAINIGRIQIATGLLVAAGVVLRVMVALSYGTRTFDFGISLLSAVVASYVMLLGIWGAVGTWPFEYRLAGVCFGIIGISVFLVIEIWDVVGIFVGALCTSFGLSLPMILIVSAIGLFRMGKLRLQQLPSGFQDPTDPWQFSIRRMMAITAIAAVIFSAARLVHLALGADAHSTTMLGAGLGFVIGYLAIPVLVVWGCLGFGRLANRLPVVIGIILVIAALPAVLTNDWPVSAVVLLTSAITVGHTLIVRSCGYRLLPVNIYRTPTELLRVTETGDVLQVGPRT